MNVLSVAFPLFPVGPDSAGGAEQVLYLLERGLTAAGHRPFVIAAAGSRVSGTCIETCVPQGEITDEVRQNVQRGHAQAIDRTLHRFPIDLIHFHGLDFDHYVPDTDIPMLATLHLPPPWYAANIFEQTRVQLNCVSESQARSVRTATKLPVISNGIDITRYAGTARDPDGLLVLGRICPEKGVHTALRIAHRLDLPLMVAGPVHPFEYHQRYFSESITPLLDWKRRYLGAVGVEEKIRLLASARCVLIASSAPETSSLVAMEAMASGTPVVAFGAGALPEIVSNGETGFIVDSEDQMADAVARVHEISPDTCRSRARDNFDCSRMVREYLALYHETVTRATPHESRSRVI